MSDGGPQGELRFLDPATQRELGRLRVHDRGAPVTDLNELEFVQGRVYANVWHTDRIAMIHPDSGDVTAWIDLQDFAPSRRATPKQCSTASPTTRPVIACSSQANGGPGCSKFGCVGARKPHRQNLGGLTSSRDCATVQRQRLLVTINAAELTDRSACEGVAPYPSSQRTSVGNRSESLRGAQARSVPPGDWGLEPRGRARRLNIPDTLDVFLCCGQRRDARRGEDGRAAGHPRSDGAADPREHGAAARIRHRPPHRADQRRPAEVERGNRLRLAHPAPASAVDFGELGRLREQSQSQVLRASRKPAAASWRRRRRTGSASRASSPASCAPPGGPDMWTRLVACCLAARLRLGPPAAGRRGPARIRDASRPAGRPVHPFRHDARRGPRRRTAATRQRHAGARGDLPDERHAVGRRPGAGSALRASTASPQPGLLRRRRRRRWRWGSAERRRCSASSRRSCWRRCPTKSRAQLVRFYQQEPENPAHPLLPDGGALRLASRPCGVVRRRRGARRITPRRASTWSWTGGPQRLRVLRGDERLLPHASFEPAARPRIRPRRRNGHAPRGVERCALADALRRRSVDGRRGPFD